jgi:hypothetical protein
MSGTIRDIKSYNFGAATASGTEHTASYSVHPLRGEVYKVEYLPAKANGSLWLRVSGTNETLAYLTGGASGTVSRIYPVLSAHNISGTELTGSVFANSLVDSLPVYVIGSGFTSGATVYDYLRVYYR